MKGLHSGIPLAVLAATAGAQVQVMGGPGGADVGNHASIPTKNTATSTVNDDFKDDHSFELEHEVKVYPPGHDHHKRVAGGPGPSVIGGPSGDDIGNGFAAASVNTFSSEVNEDYKDDHSVDIDKTTIIKPNHHHHRRGDNFPEVPHKPTVIGGPSGDNIGNVADIPTLNEFASSVKESYVDNHSVDVDKNTIVKPHWRRQHSSVIDGPSGDDVGSAAFLADVNKFSSSFTGKYKDDHSVDVDKTTIVKPGGHQGYHGQEKGEDYGNEKGQEKGKEYGQEKGQEKGEEYGNEKGQEKGEEYGNEKDQEYGQEHGTGFHHPPNKHEARDEPSTVIGGPSGDDIGNVADIPTVNSFTSNFDGHYTDDHSVDVDKTFIVKPHKARALRPGQEDEHSKHGEDVTVIGGPNGDDVGNGFGAANVNTVDTETNESVNDDHSVKVEETEIINPGGEHIHPIKPHSEGHGTEHHSSAEEPAPSKPVQHDSHSESDPECTKVHEVVHTVTSTRTAVETATHTVWPQPAHSEGQEPSHNQYPSAGSPSSPHGQEQAPAASQYQSEQNGSKHNYPENGSSSWNSKGSEESGDSGHAKGQDQAPATPQYQSEQDGKKNNYPETGSSSWNSKGSEESGDSGHAKGQEQAPSAPQYGGKNDENNENNSGNVSGWSDSQAPEQPSNSENAKGQQQAPAAPQYQEGNDSNNPDPEAGSSWSNSQAPAQSSNSQYSGQSGTSEQQSPSKDQGQDKSSLVWSSPSSSKEEGSYNASPAPAASEVYYGAHSSHAAWESTPTSGSYGSHDYSHAQYQPSPASQGAYNAPAASAITVAEASSFSVIPVHAPSGTPRAHAHGSVVVASSSTPVSSAFRVHNPSVPTGASPEQNHRNSPSPSPSTNGVAEFTGGAGRVAKIEGLCGVLVGVFTLLAFAL
ncbi:putative GPI anchored protein [Aspergillus foveolatus]|uniref:putative GPI anchored protein n=1 Tax=Aspergillus foveolatus TaxID=210207 RepID=UPI003CCD47A5